jgi:hypothetical protein
MNKRKKVFALFCLVSSGLIGSLFLLHTSEREEDILRFFPDKTIAYFETQDLKDLVSSIRNYQSFDFQAEEIPSGISFALAITNLEFQVDEVNRDETLINLKPKFLGILKTGYPQNINLSFAENQLDSAIRSFNPEISISKKGDGRIVWFKNEEERFFCLALDKLIFFSNDSKLIEFVSAKIEEQGIGNKDASKETTFFATTENEANSYKNPLHKEFVTPEEIKREREKAGNSLAFAYVSKACISKLTDLIAVSLANVFSDDEKTKAVLLKVLPVLISSSFESVSWKMEKEQNKIRDTFLLKTEESLAEVFKTTFQPDESNFDDVSELIKFVPSEASGFTRYSFQNPRLAWRSFVLSIAQKIKMSDYSAIADLFFESYGIRDPEGFLDSVGRAILVVRFNESEPVVISKVKDAERLKNSVVSEINFAKEPIKELGTDVWKSDDWAVAFFEGKVFLGSPENISKCLKAGQERLIFFDVPRIPRKSPIFTVSKSKISTKRSETSFLGSGFQYKVSSESGLISSLVNLANPN